MLLHIGNGKTVRVKSIIGIFDLDNATISRESRAYLSHATRASEVNYADSDIPRAFLVLSERGTKAAPSERGKKEGLSEKGEEKGDSATVQCTALEQMPPVCTPRARHPRRRGGEKRTPPTQTVLLSHISSVALHARCERPLLDED